MAYNYEYPYTDPSRYNDDWILKTVKDVLTQVSEYTEWKEQHKREYQALSELVNDMKIDLDRIYDGYLPESTMAVLREWVIENANSLISEVVRFVFFGLTDSGYFVAYIPDNWRDISFDTDVDPDSTEFGKLKIIY